MTGIDPATLVELGDLKTIARDKGWGKAFQWIHAHVEADVGDHTLTEPEREAARHRVLECLVNCFSGQLEEVPMGDALIACEEIVQAVTERTHNPVGSAA